MDMNSYFASCEQHLCPALRNRPVAVTPVVVDSGCCIAANYLAKKRGVKTGYSVGEARALCPDIAIVKSRPEEYVKLHHALVDLTENCMHVDEVASIDEWCCHLTGKWREEAEALALARKIKERLAEFSPVMRCSIGIAPNRWLAKVASDMQKPDGLTLIRENEIGETISGMKLREICGIGKRMEQRLAAYGIRSVAQLFALPREHMRIIWGGVFGERFYLQLHGFDLPPLETKRSQIGHSRVLPPELRSPQGVRACTFRLLQRACVRLRSEGYVAERLSLVVSSFGGESWKEEISLAPSRATPAFIDALKTLWERRREPFLKPSYCAVILCGLTKRGDATLSLFSRQERCDDALAAAMDKLTRAYGQKVLTFGGAMGAIEEGAPRIAFTRVPDLETES